MFAFETLEFLQRNGRIGRGQALVGGLLGVRPLLTLVEGEVEPLGRVRGHARLLAELERLVCEDTRPDERAARRRRARAGRGDRERHRRDACAAPARRP